MRLIKRFRCVRRNSVNIDKIVGDGCADNAHAFSDVIDGYAMHVELPATADVATQRKSAAIAYQRSQLIYPAANRYHAAQLARAGRDSHREFSVSKAAYGLGRASRHGSTMTDELYKLFTYIGCIMEDASAVALIWDRKAENAAKAKFEHLSRAHHEIARLLSQIKTELDRD